MCWPIVAASLPPPPTQTHTQGLHTRSPHPHPTHLPTQFFLLSWLAPLILYPIIAKAAAEEAERRQRAAQEEARRAANPFAGVEDLFSSFKRQGSGGRGGVGGRGEGAAGQTIDISFEVLDDDK